MLLNRGSRWFPLRHPLFLLEALSKMHGYIMAPNGPHSAPNHFVPDALRKAHASESRLPRLPRLLPFFLKAALSEMHGYIVAPSGSHSAPNRFMPEALSETCTSESWLPLAPTAPTPAPALFARSLRRNARLRVPPRLLFILLN